MFNSKYPAILPGRNGFGNITIIGSALDGAANGIDSRTGQTITIRFGKLYSVGSLFVLVAIGPREQLVKVERRDIVGFGEMKVGTEILVGDIHQKPRPHALRGWVFSSDGRIHTKPLDPLAKEKKTIQIALDECTIDARNRGNFDLWGTRNRGDWEHDLAHLLHADALRSIQIEYLDKSDVVVRTKKLVFAPDRSFRPPTNGVGQVLGRNSEITGLRLTLTEGEVTPEVRAKLRLNWATAETLKRLATERVENPNSANRTGGRISGFEEVSSRDRRELLVVRTGPKFAWAQTMDAKTTGIFLHPDDAPKGLQFRVGDKLSGFLFVAPGAIRAKNIRRAS